MRFGKMDLTAIWGCKTFLYISWNECRAFPNVCRHMNEVQRLVWGLLAASALANHLNCVGLDRSVCHHRNTWGLKTVACALMCHGTQRWEQWQCSLAPCCWWQFNSKLIMENSGACLGFVKVVCTRWKVLTHAFRWFGSYCRTVFIRIANYWRSGDCQRDGML